MKRALETSIHHVPTGQWEVAVRAPIFHGEDLVVHPNQTDPTTIDERERERVVRRHIVYPGDRLPGANVGTTHVAA